MMMRRRRRRRRRKLTTKRLKVHEGWEGWGTGGECVCVYVWERERERAGLTSSARRAVNGSEKNQGNAAETPPKRWLPRTRRLRATERTRWIYWTPAWRKSENCHPVFFLLFAKSVACLCQGLIWWVRRWSWLCCSAEYSSDTFRRWQSI